MPQFKTANEFKWWKDVWHLLFGLQTLQLEYLSLKVKEILKKEQREDGRTNVKKLLEKIS